MKKASVPRKLQRGHGEHGSAATKCFNHRLASLPTSIWNREILLSVPVARSNWA
jgi:hypothetical protein